MIQLVSFISATFETFVEAHLCLLVSGKNYAEVIKFLGILNKHVSKNNIYFCLRNKSNVSPNKKVLFLFPAIFKLDFVAQIIYCIFHRCLCSHFHTLFVLLYTSLRNGT